MAIRFDNMTNLVSKWIMNGGKSSDAFKCYHVAVLALYVILVFYRWLPSGEDRRLVCEQIPCDTEVGLGTLLYRLAMLGPQVCMKIYLVFLITLCSVQKQYQWFVQIL